LPKTQDGCGVLGRFGDSIRELGLIWAASFFVLTGHGRKQQNNLAKEEANL
jgi:hypothetical protein